MTHLIFTIIFSVVSAFCSSFTNYYVQEVEVYSFYYNEQEDIHVTTFKDASGEMYAHDDFIAPRFAKAILIMDNQGTDFKYDDTIENVILVA